MTTRLGRNLFSTKVAFNAVTVTTSGVFCYSATCENWHALFSALQVKKSAEATQSRNTQLSRGNSELRAKVANQEIALTKLKEKLKQQKSALDRHLATRKHNAMTENKIKVRARCDSFKCFMKFRVWFDDSFVSCVEDPLTFNVKISLSWKCEDGFNFNGTGVFVVSGNRHGIGRVGEKQDKLYEEKQWASFCHREVQLRGAALFSSYNVNFHWPNSILLKAALFLYWCVETENLFTFAFKLPSRHEPDRQLDDRVVNSNTIFYMLLNLLWLWAAKLDTFLYSWHNSMTLPATH